ncbi:helix-turn-helix transcriptional regulator [Siphonobacter aquaeclarae]|jgi:predicted DNA-binding transcriptional regulator YafY|uniref:Predicted DNA-binding transcriptional regulator YafY, contains an HTH and WYL domains n=1 Tax=Siphonobacter aquaeclarae TaxID=563176 RepID=A0A1G9MQ90_9BACT|nr:YafY family protein [Siphonobacter aquaeclarae]SDL76284.1 Predicted DNA-binding transcriptional regulator YafY, contains an HTH and WYL domains [Siphonobacter aquaeclarae]
MNRIDRVTAILIQLQSRKIVKAQDIADRFGISLRTVYRDVRTLEEAGVPIIGEAGVGYSIMDGYRLPPVMFTREEAATFLLAEKFLEKFADASTEAAYKSAMYKVRAVLRSSEKEMLENMEQFIEVHQYAAPFAAETDVLQSLVKHIPERRVVEIRYQTYQSADTTQREVEPMGVFYGSGSWHLIGWCRLRKDYRDFRVDRIVHLQVREERFTSSHPSLKEYLGKMHNYDAQRVVIRVHKSVSRYLEKQRYSYGFLMETEGEDDYEMTFLANSIDGFARWYITFADYAKIIEPTELKEKMIGLVEKYFNMRENF